MMWFIDSGVYHRGVLSRGRVLGDCGIAASSTSPTEPPPSADLICGACQRVVEGGPRRAAGTEDLIGAAARADLADRVAAAARQFARWLTARAGRGTREDLARPGRWAREAEDNLWHSSRSRRH